MKWPTVDIAALGKPAWWEFLLRFVFGGLVTVGTGLVDKKFGAAWGGMLVAFPSILPASLTLVKRHDGRQSAIDDARGARVATFGLLAFAIVVAMTSTRWTAPIVLLTATAAWFAISSALWAIEFARD